MYPAVAGPMAPSMVMVSTRSAARPANPPSVNARIAIANKRLMMFLHRPSSATAGTAVVARKVGVVKPKRGNGLRPLQFAEALWLDDCVVTVSSLLESARIHSQTQYWNQNDTPPEPKPVKEPVVSVR
jgi:hypothetical protein